MDRQLALSKEKPLADDWLQHSEALVAARTGRLTLAEQHSDQAVGLARDAGQEERAAAYVTAVAVWDALYGRPADARREALLALDRSKGRDVEFGAALAMALSGESAKTEELASDLGRRLPEDTSVQSNYLPTLGALVALRKGNAERSIDLLAPVVPRELWVTGLAFNESFGALYPIYARGLAELALNRPALAAIEFQKILDHPGTVLADPVGTAARVELARALVRAGSTAKAKATYEEVLTLWKDADAGLPFVAQVRAEYAALKPE
jgi:hypothetical protein